MTVAPLGVSRPMSIEAVNRALAGDRMVLLLLQKNDTDEPGPDDLQRVGTVAIIRQMAKSPGGMRVLVEGIARARAEFLQVDKGAMTALIKPLPEPSSARSRSMRTCAGCRSSSIVRCRSPPACRPDIKALVEHGRSAAHRLSAGQPARHEAGGQAETARGEQPRRSSSTRSPWPCRAKSRCSS